MIKSLRRKVFWSILLSAAGVLFVILLAINVLKLAQTASMRDSILNSALMMLHTDERESGAEENAEPGRINNRGGRGKAELLRSVSEDELGVILLDAEGTVINEAGCATDLDDDTLSSLAQTAFADTDGKGRFGGWEYRVYATEGGISVSFLNASSLRSENIETVLLSLAAFAVAFGLFALVSDYLSRVIVKPVEENMQMQKRFVSDASHELKTPLAVIEANASVLEQSVGQNKWLDYIKEQSGRMAGLINELLQLSKIEEAKETEAPRQAEQFDAAEAVLSAALPFESVAFEHGVTLETDAPDILDVCGNRKELEQLAGILIDNAVKHSPAGGTVYVTLSGAEGRHNAKGSQFLELRVKNSGDTIPPEALPHIFDRFYRVDESRTHKDNSYGLGLAIAKGLAEKNNGSITVTSENGVTEFTLRLPVSTL